MEKFKLAIDSDKNISPVLSIVKNEEGSFSLAVTRNAKLNLDDITRILKLITDWATMKLGSTK